MSDTVRCPDCGTPTPLTARFCPGCGRPRTFLQDQLAQEALLTGEHYTELLDRARAEELATVPLETTLARLERRLNDVETLTREINQRTGGKRTAPMAAGPSIVRAPVPRVVEERVHPSEPVERERVPSRPLPPSPAPPAGIDLETLITGRVLAWAGGIAIALGAAFFLSLAFSNNWIGPAARVIIGVVASLVMISAGAWFFERKEALFGLVLVATSLGVMSLSLVAATRLYEFIPAEVGVPSALAVAAIAALIAIRANSQTVAVFGLITALIAPPLVGASASYTTLAFVAVALTGAVTVALYRDWFWLPPLAFVLSAPQAADWLTGDVAAGIALGVLAGFWALYTLAAGGEEFRRTTDRLKPSSATLLVANAVFLVGMGFEILSGDLEPWRGSFLVGVALLHGSIGGYFLYKRHERHPFGMLGFGTGVAALTMAIPVQFGGPVVAIGWAAQATALAWVYSRRQHGYSGALALALAALSIGHLFRFEYPLFEMPNGVESAWPYVNSSGTTLAFLLAALAVTGYFVKGSRLPAFLVVTGGAMIALSAPFEVRPAAAVVIWSALAATSWMLARNYSRDDRLYTQGARALLGGAAAWTLLSIAAPDRLFVDSQSTISHPLFWTSATVALASLVAALAFGFWTRRTSPDGPIMAVIAAGLTVYLLSIGTVDEFQSRVGGATSLEALQKQSQVALSILWATLGVLSFVVGLVKNEHTGRSFGLALLALATAKVFIYDLASLDASYRVLSFIGLGVILLASSFAYQHFVPLFERQEPTAPSGEGPSA
jgi:uncharacterized membrane protein